MIITLSQFKDAMAEVLKKHEKELKRVWNLSFSEYTAIWEQNGENSGVYQSLAEKLGMKWYGQYWSLDAVFFKEWSKHSDGYGASFLSLVIEHENNCDTSTQEINRLLAATASLKVLVTYPGLGYEQEWLNKYTKQIEIVDDIWPGYSAQQRNVVIFGDMDEKKELVWNYYIYRHGKFCLF